MEVFARTGYNATTMESIAAHAGTGKGTLYEYFNSKQELFLACFDAYMTQYCEALEAESGPPGAGAGLQIRQAARIAFDLADEMEELFPLTFEFWAASASPPMRDLFRKMYARLRAFFGEMIRRGIERGEFDPNIDVEAVTAVLVGSFDGLFLQAWFDQDMNARRAGESFVDVLLRGLARGASRPPKTRAGGGHA